MTIHEYQRSHHTRRVWESTVEADRAFIMWDDSAPHTPATAHGTVIEVRARRAKKPFLASRVTQFPIWEGEYKEETNYNFTHPGAMVIETHSAFAACRTVVCPGSFQTAIAVAFVTGRQFTSFVDAFKWGALLRESFWQNPRWCWRAMGYQS